MTSARSAKRATKTPIDLTPPTSGATSTPPVTATGSVTGAARRQPPAPRCCLQDQEAQQNHDRGNRRHPKLVGLPLSGISEHLGVVLVREGHPAQT